MSSKVARLSLHGGEPVRKEPFPSWPRPTEAIKESLIHTLNNEKWGIGSETVERFEREFARFHDSRSAISTNSGTAALWVALKAAGVKPGDEIIIPAYTFVATASAVLMANAVPVFVDIDPETLNIDPDLIENAITEKSRVIMPVHIAGNPAHLSRIKKIAENHRIVMIEDAAQAHGAEWGGIKVGSIGLGGIFSFQSSKNMTAGEGGAIVSNDETFINRCFSYHNVGRIRGGGWYRHRYLGGNFRLSAFPAAILLAQISSLEEDMKIRDANASILDREIRKIPGLQPVEQYSETTRVSHHIYIFRYNRSKFSNTTRDDFIKALNAEGIPAHTGYKPLYREDLFVADKNEYPWLSETDFSKLYLPITERVSNVEAIWIKQNCLLGSEEDTMDIVQALLKLKHVYGD